MNIEQAIYGGQDAGGYQFLGRSPGFLDGWLAEAERLCTGFGERPPGASCPLAVFAQALARNVVAVVQVSDQGRDDAGRPGALCFRLLAVPTATTLDVEWFGFGDWPLQANRRDIRIERHGAAPLYRRITAVNPVTDGERLVLDAALPGGFSVDQVACISFMALCRQDADVNALRLWGQGVVQSQLTFVGCQHGL